MKVTMLMKRTGERHWRMPAVSAYTAERELQAMLLESPELLPAEEDRRPIVLADEFPVNFGSVDLVGVSAAGWITVVECKLRANSEIKRSIVGQLFAYGAALWEMSYEDFDQRWRQRMDVALIEHVATQAAEHGSAWDRDGFVSAVASNLEAGRFTLVVAVDEITAELRRIIEYLSLHTVGDVAVVALELGYVADGDCQIIVPQTYGVELAERKSSSTRPRNWTLDEFRAATSAQGGTDATAVLEAGLVWVQTHGGSWVLGRGKYGPLYLVVSSRDGQPVKVLAIDTGGGVSVYYVFLKDYPPFDDPGERLGINRRLNGIGVISIADDMAVKASWPTVRLDALRPPGDRAAFFRVFDDVAARLAAPPSQ